MITWSSRPLLAALGLLALAACEPGQGGGFLEGLASGSSSRSFALAEAPLGAGEVTLVPPQGYCIDRRSLRPDFAILARCDILGAQSAGAGAPIGIFTVSLSPLAADAPLPSPTEKAQALGLTGLSDIEESEDRVLFRAQGAAPAAGLGEGHWRGIFRANGHALGAAFYRSADASGPGSEGRALLAELARRTQERTD